MTFRFAAKHGLLTYSALGNDMDAVEGLAHRIVEHLGVLGAECIIDERITLMEDFISMLSLCSNGSLSQEMSVFSMWTASTRTLSVVTRMQTLAALMLAKRATLSQEDLTQDNYELRWIDMVESE